MSVHKSTGLDLLHEPTVCGRHPLRRRLRWAWTATWVAGALGALPAWARVPGDDIHRWQHQRVTPHVAWAKPWAKGKVHALMVVQTYVGSREAGELVQRLDCNLTVVSVRARNVFAATDRYHAQVEGSLLAEKTAELRAKLRTRYDVIILANFELAALPVELQVGVLEQVVQGTGLVLTFGMQHKPAFLRKPVDQDRDVITRGLPLGVLPYYQEHVLAKGKAKTRAELMRQVVRTFALRKGRMVVLDYTHRRSNYWGANALCAEEPFSFQAPTWYEYHHALVARSILWATHAKQPDLRWDAVPDPLVVDRPALPVAASLSLRCPADRAGTVRVRTVVRDTVNQVEARSETSVALRAGINKIAVHVPALPAGLHFVDCWIVSHRGVENWATIPVQVRARTALGPVVLASPFCPAGQSLRGTAEVRRQGDGPAPTALDLSITDTHGRVIERNSVAIHGPGQHTFAVAVRAPLTLAGRLRVALRAGASVVDTRDLEVFFPRRDVGPFVGVIWNINSNARGMMMRYAADLARSAGFRAALSAQGSSAEFAHEYALCDMRMVPVLTHIPSHKTQSFTSKKTRDYIRDRIPKRARELAPYKPLVYNLGDENYIPRDLARSGDDLVSYRKWLHKKYGTIQRLNAAWGTSLEGFDQVTDTTTAEAQKTRHYTPYHDFETFREWLYADMHHEHMRRIQQGDPGAPVGAEGSQPGDLEVTLPGLGLWSPYQRRYGNALLNSLAPRSLWRGNWWGGYVSQRRGTARQRMVWTSLLDGCNSIWCFEADCSAEGIYDLDLSFAKHFRPLLPMLDEIFGGVGPLLATSRWPADGVAIHHSQASVHAGRVCADLDRVPNAQDAWLAVCQGLGVIPKHLTARQIQQGRLDPKRWRVLILPYSQAIGDAEAKAIRQFVQAGGWVVADTRPGVLRGDAGPRPRGVLDDLFGIRRTAKPGVARLSKPVRLSGRLGSARVEVTVHPTRADAAVRLAGGTALGHSGDVPIGVHRAHGRGMAVLVNAPMGAIGSVAGARAARDLVRLILSAAGAPPRLRLVGPDGRDLDNVRLCALQRTGCTVVGVLSAGPTKATLQLSAPGVVYDVRARRRIGRRQRVALSLTVDDATLLAVCREEVRSVRVAGPDRAKRGQVVRVGVSVLGPSGPLPERVVRVDVHDPQGRALYYQRQVIECKKGDTPVRVPIAYSDPKGPWRVVARDVASGLEGAATLTIE